MCREVFQPLGSPFLTERNGRCVTALILGTLDQVIKKAMAFLAAINWVVDRSVGIARLALWGKCPPMNGRC